jgi:hypothetical protein
LLHPAAFLGWLPVRHHARSTSPCSGQSDRGCVGETTPLAKTRRPLERTRTVTVPVDASTTVPNRGGRSSGPAPLPFPLTIELVAMSDERDDDVSNTGRKVEKMEG